MAELLTREGFGVRVARGADEALAILPEFRAQMVVLDLVLPGRSGLLLARELKAGPLTQDLMLVAVSPLDGPDVERLARQAGCAAYLPRPIDSQTFARTLASHLMEQP